MRDILLCLVGWQIEQEILFDYELILYYDI